MFVTYLFHIYLLGTDNVKCLYAFETGIADTELSPYIALKRIPWRDILNLNTFDNLRVIHLSKLETCFHISTTINYLT